MVWLTHPFMSILTFCNTLLRKHCLLEIHDIHDRKGCRFPAHFALTFFLIFLLQHLCSCRIFLLDAPRPAPCSFSALLAPLCLQGSQVLLPQKRLPCLPPHLTDLLIFCHCIILFLLQHVLQMIIFFSNKLYKLLSIFLSHQIISPKKEKSLGFIQ